jgi:hypothetical protein
MATSFEHRALVEQLRALTSKRAENPGEKILNTSHPSGSNSAADDHTRPAVVGHRYQENSEDNKEMYPAGTDSDTKLEAGSQQSDPGHNKGLHPRPSGEAPEVERKYNLNEHNDPGTSHPSGKAAQAFAAEARSLAAEIRNLIKSATGDSYVTGEVAEEAVDTTEENASGTSKYPVNAENDGNIEIPENAGKNAAEMQKIAVLKAQATHDMRNFTSHMKESAKKDAESFIETVMGVMNKFAAPHVAPVVEQIKQAQAAEAYAIKQAEVAAAMEKIAVYDALAEVDGSPKFAEILKAAEEGHNKKPDADGDGIPDWADNMPASMEPASKKKKEDGEEGEKEAFADALRKLANEISAPSKKEALRKRGTFRKKAEDEVEDSVDEDCEDDKAEDMPESEDISKDEEMAAEEALADMAAMPSGSPDGEMGMDPAMMDPAMMDPAMMGGDPMAGGSGLSPEEEAALMALIQQEGMKESDVKTYAKIASSIASGKLHPSKLSQAQKAFVAACDKAVKTAGAKFQTLRSASRLRNELNSIYRGIQ